jgi:hypothetical protein
MSFRQQLIVLLGFCLCILTFLNDLNSDIYKFSIFFSSYLFSNFELARESTTGKSRVGIIFDDEVLMTALGFKQENSAKYADRTKSNVTAFFQIAQSAMVPTFVERNWSDGDVMATFLTGESLQNFCDNEGFEIVESFNDQILLLRKRK